MPNSIRSKSRSGNNPDRTENICPCTESPNAPVQGQLLFYCQNDAPTALLGRFRLKAAFQQTAVPSRDVGADAHSRPRRKCCVSIESSGEFADIWDGKPVPYGEICNRCNGFQCNCRGGYQPPGRKCRVYTEDSGEFATSSGRERQRLPFLKGSNLRLAKCRASPGCSLAWRLRALRRSRLRGSCRQLRSATNLMLR